MGGEEEEDDDTEVRSDVPWYSKAAPMIDQCVTISKRICVTPGSRLSIDEMMKRFKGRSGQTHRMKHQPIKEGYKFFSLRDAETGFVYDMSPNGRLQSMTFHDMKAVAPRIAHGGYEGAKGGPKGADKGGGAFS